MGYVFDHNGSRNCLLSPDCRGVAAEREKRRLGCGFRRAGQPDSVWSAGRGFGAFPGDDLVRDHFYGHFDHTFDFCGAPNRTYVRAFRSETGTDEVATGNSHRAFCAAKDLALQKMRTGGTLRYMLPWMAAEIEEIDQVFGGDPWPYGIEPNRATLAALVQYMAEQGLIAAPVAIEDLFVPTFGLG